MYVGVHRMVDIASLIGILVMEFLCPLNPENPNPALLHALLLPTTPGKF